MSTMAPAASLDTQRMMMYDANKKSVGVAFLLWFFLGGLGAHRFYMGKTGSAIAMAAITVVSLALTVVFIGFFTLGIVGIWALVDAFMISGWVNAHNAQLINRLSA
ncbi:MAG: TM2 domain-containing protein [Gemmatimonadota bacterium]